MNFWGESFAVFLGVIPLNHVQVFIFYRKNYNSRLSRSKN